MVGTPGVQVTQVVEHGIRRGELTIEMRQLLAGLADEEPACDHVEAGPNGGANYKIAERFTLRLPATVWRTWRDTSYEGIGITPHVIVEQCLADLRAGVDTQLERAKTILSSM